MGTIRGQDRNQQTYWSLEDMIAEESMVRVIDRFVDSVDLRSLGFTRTQGATTGRPSYAAASLAKLYVYGYESGIRSSRKLEKETYRNIEVMWLVQGVKPDHSSISEFRRLNVKAIKQLFREFVKLCQTWELTDGKVVAQDGTKINASNGSHNNFKPAGLNDRIKRIDEKIAEYLSSMDQADQSNEADKSTGVPQNMSPGKLLELLNRKQKYESYKDQMQAEGISEISTVDPDARQMGSSSKGFDISYNTQIAVDGKHHIVLDFDVTNNPSDRGELAPMAKSLIEDGYIASGGDTTYLADKGYYSGEDLAEMDKLGIKAVVPSQNPPHPIGQPKMFWCSSFQYNHTSNSYTCPAGHILSQTTSRNPAPKRRRYTNKAACQHCQHSKLCIGGKAEFRTVTRGEFADIHEAADKTYAQNSERYKLRMQLAEHPFGTIKHTMNGSYFLLRTLPKVRGEAALLFLAYNLKRAYNTLGFKEIMARLDCLLCTFVHTSNLERIFYVV